MRSRRAAAILVLCAASAGCGASGPSGAAASGGQPPATGGAGAVGPLKLSPNVLGSRYQDFRAFPDGSVAYPAPGSTASKIEILRVLGCGLR